MGAGEDVVVVEFIVEFSVEFIAASKIVEVVVV